MNEHRDKPYVKWGLTALAVIFISILLVVIFTNLPGFFGMLTTAKIHAARTRTGTKKSGRDIWDSRRSGAFWATRPFRDCP